MSIEILDDIQHWDLPKLIWRNTRKLRNQQFDLPFRVDDPEHCRLGQNYWKNYSCQHYQYQFNDWGFRDSNNFEQYRKEVYPDKVNICIGDSFTVNFGAPHEHAWPQLLAKKMQIPTLNFGIDGLTSYYYFAVANKTKQLFNVDKVFVLYNLFENHNLSELKQLSQIRLTNASDRAKFLKKYCWIYDAHWQFVPSWVFCVDELSCLYEHFPKAHDYIKNIKLNFCDVDINLLLEINPLRDSYYEIAGSSWMLYEKFCQSVLIGENVLDYFSAAVDKRLVNEFLSGHFIPTIKQMLLTNRDGWHISQQVNQALADYFYQQTLTGC